MLGLHALVSVWNRRGFPLVGQGPVVNIPGGEGAKTQMGFPLILLLLFFYCTSMIRAKIKVALVNVC